MVATVKPSGTGHVAARRDLELIPRSFPNFLKGCCRGVYSVQPEVTVPTKTVKTGLSAAWWSRKKIVKNAHPRHTINV